MIQPVFSCYTKNRRRKGRQATKKNKTSQTVHSKRAKKKTNQHTYLTWDSLKKKKKKKENTRRSSSVYYEKKNQAVSYAKIRLSNPWMFIARKQWLIFVFYFAKNCWMPLIIMWRWWRLLLLLLGLLLHLMLLMMMMMVIIELRCQLFDWRWRRIVIIIEMMMRIGCFIGK